MLDLAVFEHDHIGRAGADIEQDGSGLFLLASQYRFGGSQAGDGMMGGRDLGFLQGLVQGTHIRGGGGDDMGVNFKPDAVHAHRILDVPLPVQTVILSEELDDFPVGGQRYDGGGFFDAQTIFGVISRLAVLMAITPSSSGR